MSVTAAYLQDNQFHAAVCGSGVATSSGSAAHCARRRQRRGTLGAACQGCMFVSAIPVSQPAARAAGRAWPSVGTVPCRSTRCQPAPQRTRTGTLPSPRRSPWRCTGQGSQPSRITEARSDMPPCWHRERSGRLPPTLRRPASASAPPRCAVLHRRAAGCVDRACSYCSLATSSVVMLRHTLHHATVTP